MATGMPCCENSDCASNSCSSTYTCQGSSKNSQCTSSISCNTGLYCSNNICTLLKKLNDPCTTDDECAIGAGCNNNICTMIFSLSNQVSATNPKFCQSNFVFNGNCESISVFSGSQQLHPPYECSLGSKCVYKTTDGSVFHTSACLCGGTNSTTEGFCGEYAQYLPDVMQMYSELQYSTSLCSGSYAHSSNVTELFLCGSISYPQFYKYIRFFGQYKYLGLFETHVVDQCSMSLMLFDWNYTFVPTLSMAALINLGVLWALV